LAGLIIVSGKPGIFIAGADLREFAASINDITPEQTFSMCQRGQKLFARLSECSFVTVAAIDGTCVGGGAELAVWCDRRVMTSNPRTEFGFPEVKLGIFPGWGGTARAPRIVGLSNAVEMITSGESIDAESAYKMGLVSDVVEPADLLGAAVRLVRDEQQHKTFLQDRCRWHGPVDISETELGFLGATASAVIQQQTKGQYPAPPAALEVMLGSAGVDIETACDMEAKGMSKLFGSEVNAALLNIFFLTDRNKKDTGVSTPDIAGSKIESVSVIGAGIMGAGIAAANVKRNVHVTLSDANKDALGRGVAEVLKEVSYNKKTKAADVDRAIEFAPNLTGTQSEHEVASSDLVIEAIVENADVKKQVYAKLEPLLGPTAILASNTSTIPITQLASGLKNPDRFCGIHFFNPVRRMQLVEVIRGEQTSDETIVTAVQYAKKIGKSPIVVNDGPGFLVNRLLLPYMNEALELLAEGAPIPDIEKASKKFGMPMGPITLYDVVGLDTAFYAGRTMWEAFPDRIGASPILPALVKAGRLGQKTGLGFFSYQNKHRKGTPDPDLQRYVEPYRKGTPRDFSSEEITNRLFLPMLLEATRVLQDKIVRNVRDVDLGLIFGLGFPPFKGGLLHWADTLGAAKIIELLKPFADMGVRMQPTPLLEQMAAYNQKFYSLTL
jgi:3-hydroxyacyl-CoA dehydrogenase/enoyl-CoA hydratase/3-hydroxybutyryl-CoA epimerase/3-hydroxyacyl-CoA dehydrogenase/enoyl-CoA hydratase/3-hydroxybutyryl-CoA epimerase/enoyl-CoA isomerase